MKKILKNVVDIVEGRSPERKSSAYRHKSRRNLRDSDERHPKAFNRPSQRRYQGDDYDEYERDRTRSSDRSSRDRDREREREQERERGRHSYSHRRQRTDLMTPLHDKFDEDPRFHDGDHVQEAVLEQTSASEGWRRNYGVRYVRDRNGKAVRKTSFVDEYLERSDEDGLDDHHRSHGGGRHRDQDWGSGRGRDPDEYAGSPQDNRRRYDHPRPPPSAFPERSRASSHTGWRYQGKIDQGDADYGRPSRRRHQGARVSSPDQDGRRSHGATAGSPTVSREQGRILGEVDEDD